MSKQIQETQINKTVISDQVKLQENISNNATNEIISNTGKTHASLSRSEKSLTALTTKFMTLLQESNNGILDLRSVN